MLGEVVIPGLFFQHDAASGRYEDLELGRGFIGPSLDYRKIEKLEL
ncbi:MAG: phytanoyl-CoA dioxygenase, partial [Myxococcales bacterium]|nr:phytanoyl-CoA dioxygenase [Myxococcales bacterium]